MDRTEAERQLAEYARVTGTRDQRVLAALDAGLSKHRIHLLSGISRSTLDRIIDHAKGQKK